MTPFEEVLKKLEDARLAQQKIIDEAIAKMNGIDAAIEHFKTNVMVIDPAHIPKRKDYEHLGLVDAAKAWLTEAGSAHTGDIARGLVTRGIISKSKKMTSNVFASLDNARGTFIREGDGTAGVWRLRRPDDPPPIPKGTKKKKSSPVIENENTSEAEG